MSDPVVEVSSDLIDRVSLLEERTKDKQKTVIDRVKEWSGVATAVFAILYTIPLGVWDRFVLTSEQRSEREVAELRGTIV